LVRLIDWRCCDDARVGFCVSASERASASASQVVWAFYCSGARFTLATRPIAAAPAI
jgi:hypothetical protein